jgi:nucleotide-binding universal stress UspA family protein
MTDRAAVVVGVDGSYCSLAALDVAADEAVWRQRPLRVLHAYALPAGQDQMKFAEPRVVTRWMVADAMSRALARHPGLEAGTRLVCGATDEVLLTESRTASLLVIGSRGLGGFRGLLAGSTGTRVTTGAHCPVIVVMRGEHAPDSGPVLLGVDGSRPSMAAIAFAFAEAAQREEPLIAFYAWVHPHSVDGDSLDLVADGFAEAKRAAIRELDEALRGWGARYSEVAVSRKVLFSLDPARELVAASTRAGIVVVGSRRRGKMRSLLFGSVGYTLIHHSSCPVAVVPPIDDRLAAATWFARAGRAGLATG